MCVEYLLGKRELISFSDFEGTYGTAGTPKVLLGRDAKFTPKNINNWTEVKGAGTDSVDIDVYELGIKGVGGSLEFAPQNWKFLNFVLLAAGTGTTDTSSTTYFTHTYTNAKTVGSFTIERAMQATTDRVRTYAGCQVNRMGVSFDAGAGGFVAASLDLMARDVVNSTSTTSLTALTTEAFKARMATITVAGNVEVACLSGNFSIENNLDAGRYGNYNNDKRLKSESGITKRLVSGTLTVNVKDDTYFDLWEAITKVSGACSLKLTRGTNDTATFTFNNFYVEDAPDPTNLEGINNVTLNFKATSVSAVVVDALSDYRTFG